MTERTEIERLLQKTGRTLEGLPEFYPEDQQQKLYREVIEKRELWENRVLHQSDVIELLIGALRDSEPIVRCKDCEWRFTSCCPMFHEEQTYNEDDGYEWVDHDHTSDDGFCNEGEPRTKS